MSKRKAVEDLDGPADDRAAKFAGDLKALNEQFAQWIKEQAATAPLELWSDGVEDYLKYGKQLAEEYADVIAAQDVASGKAEVRQLKQQQQQQQQRAEDAAKKARMVLAAEKPAASSFFGFAPAPAGAASPDRPVAALGKPPLGKPPLAGAAAAAPSKEAAPSLFGAAASAPSKEAAPSLFGAAAAAPSKEAAPSLFGAAAAAPSKEAAPSLFGAAAAAPSKEAATLPTANEGGSKPALLFGALPSTGGAFSFSSAAAPGFSSSPASTGVAASSGLPTLRSPSSAPAFGAAPSSAPAFGIFGSSSAATAPGGFSFGASSSAAASSTGFSFGPPSSAAASTGFSFGAPASAGLFGAPPAGVLAGGGEQGGEEEDEEEEQPAEPSVQVEPQEGVEVLHKARVKLMAMGENKKWADKGSGTLSLRRATGEEGAGKMPYLVFTTDAGRVLVNAPLVKGMKPMTQAKAPANLIMMLISIVDDKQEKAMNLIKCENGDARKALQAAIEEHL